MCVMDYSIANFEQAVSQFYYTDAVLQAQAHQWLMNAQTSLNAWSFVWELLQKERSAEVQFFAATTLHMKIMKSWDEVPEKEYETLRKHLLEAILNYSEGPKIVLNRLCIALSAYILQTMSGYWMNAIPELLAMFQSPDFQGLSTPKRIWILLEVLTVIPEEYQSMQMMQRHRSAVRHELEKATPQILVLVQAVLAETERNIAQVAASSGNTNNVGNHEMLCQALRCITAWLQFGISIVDCIHLATLLVRIVVENSVNSSSSEAAELGIEALDQMLTHPDASKMPTVVMNFIQRILCLKDVIRHLQETDNHELLPNYYGLFISVVESHSHLLLQCLTTDMKDVTIQLLHIILSCTNCPGSYPTQETCSKLTFGIWYILQDVLVDMEPVQQAKVLPIIVPIYQELIIVLLKKSQFPRSDAEFTPEDRETHRWYRQDVADTLMYCCNVLHETILEILLAQLQRAIDTAKTLWQQLEACLHAFAAVAENIDEKENHYLPIFFNILQTLPFDSLNIHVATATLDVIGAYANWLHYHPDMLGIVVPLLLMGLNCTETAPNATMSLKDISRDCNLALKPYSDVILQTSQRVLQEGKLKHNECVRLMYTVGNVLSILPIDNVLQYLDTLLLPCVDQIKDLMKQEPSITVKSSLLLRMKMLGMLLGTLHLRENSLLDGDADSSNTSNSLSEAGKMDQSRIQGNCGSKDEHTDSSQPVFLVLKHFIPVLNDVVNKWPTDASIIQALFNILKHGVTNLVMDCSPLIPDIVDFIVNSYKRFPTSYALDLTRQISLIVGTDSPYTQYIQNLLLLLTAHTLHLAKPESPSGGDLAPYTDVVEAYLLLISMLVKKTPLLIIRTEHFNVSNVFQFAMKALMLPELPTVRAAVIFFSTVITSHTENSDLLLCIQIHGEELVEKILRCIGGESSRTNMEVLSDVLFILNKRHGDYVARWLGAHLTRPEFPSPKPTAEAKMHFMKMILRERSNKRKAQEIVRDFSLVCRGIVNTEYAAQTSGSRYLTPDI